MADKEGVTFEGYVKFQDNIGKAIDAITQLSSKQSAGEKFTGIDVINNTVANFEKLGIIEPLKVKEQVIKSAIETANMILRIDNVVASSSSRSPEPPQGMPGMGME